MLTHVDERPESKLRERLANSMAVEISIDGSDAMEADLSFQDRTDYWGSSRTAATLPESVEKRLNEGVRTIRVRLLAEANEAYLGPFVLFRAVYAWRFDHWTYGAGVEFCENAISEDDGWFKL